MYLYVPLIFVPAMDQNVWRLIVCYGCGKKLPHTRFTLQQDDHAQPRCKRCIVKNRYLDEYVAPEYGSCKACGTDLDDCEFFTPGYHYECATEG